MKEVVVATSEAEVMARKCIAQAITQYANYATSIGTQSMNACIDSMSTLYQETTQTTNNQGQTSQTSQGVDITQVMHYLHIKICCIFHKSLNLMLGSSTQVHHIIYVGVNMEVERRSIWGE